MRAFAGKLLAMTGRLEAAVQKAAMVAAERCAETARSLVPVDSGELRESIRAGRQGKGAAVIAAAPHAAMVEYGTSRMAPQPYLVPAARQEEEAFAKEMCAAARGVLK